MTALECEVYDNNEYLWRDCEGVRLVITFIRPATGSQAVTRQTLSIGASSHSGRKT